jgi:hypothetical protein
MGNVRPCSISPTVQSPGISPSEAQEALTPMRVESAHNIQNTMENGPFIDGLPIRNGDFR